MLCFSPKAKSKKLFHSPQGLSLYRVTRRAKVEKGEKKIPKIQNMEGENFVLVKISH